MTKELTRSLGLDRIFALLEVSGELMEHARNAARWKASSNVLSLSGDYHRIKALMDIMRTEPGLKAGLQDSFYHLSLPVLPSENSTYDQHECYELKVFIHYYQELIRLLNGRLEGYSFPALEHVYKLLDPDGQALPIFRISPAYSVRLAELSTRQLELQQTINRSREEDLIQARKALGEPLLKSEFVLSRGQSELIERLSQTPYFVQSAQNIANLTFKLADSAGTTDLLAQISSLLDAKKQEERIVLEHLRIQIISYLTEIRSAIKETEKLSLDFLRADFGLKYKCVIPQLLNEPVIKIEGAINLPLKQSLEAEGRPYQAIDLDFDQRISLITGANMGGKTTVLKTTGQLVQMAKLGIPLPSRKASLGLPEELWYNHDNEKQGDNLSSFGREVVALTNVLNSGKTCLLLLDEFAKGTNPKEGEALCSAVLRYLADSPHSCVAATHYTAPSQLKAIAQYTMAGLDEQALANLAAETTIAIALKDRLKIMGLAMDYRLIRLDGHQVPPPAAIKIARALGLPPAILKYLDLQDDHA